MTKKETKHSVEMVDMQFSPPSITVRSGDYIVWNNQDQTEHNAQRDEKPNSFATRLLDFGESSKPIKFTEEGTFEYFCQPHASFMKGIIVVKSADDCSGD